MNPCDPIVQQARQNLLDQAYVLEGRHDPDNAHPMRGLYTALTLTTAYDCLSNPSTNDRGFAG